MKILLLIWTGKLLSFLSILFRAGAGSTWPGHLALSLEPEIISKLASELGQGVILVAGTNGKTTTVSMIKKIMGGKVISNESGANLRNGVASTLIVNCNWQGKLLADGAVFEIDEATLPLILKDMTPKVIVLLNLFRDQLDRYGEVDTIAEKWLRLLRELEEKTTVILNADDPHVASLGQNLKAKVLYFGLNDSHLFLKKMEHAVDSVYCPQCGKRLSFAGIFYSHLGIWDCPECGLKRPEPDLSSWSNWSNLKGVYNRYNTLAAILTAKVLKIPEEKIKKELLEFQPAFGRQEELNLNGKKLKILLSKNPAGFNESLRVLEELPDKKKTILLALNDRIPDGRDVSWIWDVDFEMLPDNDTVLISGDRAFDMGLRIKYSRESQKAKVKIYDSLKEAIGRGLDAVNMGETLYILPTYSAMLDVRKIVGGRKIL